VLDLFTRLLVGFLEGLVRDVNDSVSSQVESYLLSTHDLSTISPRPLTEDPALQAMYHLTVGIADTLLVLIFIWSFLRSQWERSFRAHYTLKVMLPRAMLAVALAHFGLLFGQMAIDLNNAMVHAVWQQKIPGAAAGMPWASALSTPFGFPLFMLAVRLAIVVMLVILTITYVMRFALLSVLLAVAPLAAICLILPETKSYARSWSKLFLLTVFMQFGQVLVLRLASAFVDEINGSLMRALYGLAVLYLVVKVPGLMSASAHLELKVQHLGEGAIKHAIKAATATPRTGSH
jgi:hypothetical protein